MKGSTQNIFMFSHSLNAIYLHKNDMIRMTSDNKMYPVHIEHYEYSDNKRNVIQTWTPK